MKKLLAVALFAGLLQPVLAENHTPDELSVKVDLTFQAHHEHYAVNDEIKMDSDNHHWVLIDNKKASPDRYLLLAKIANADAEKVTMKFLMIDTDKNPSVVSKPEMVLSYGQKSELKIKSKDGKLDLIILAKA